jgi:hypothetical protein
MAVGNSEVDITKWDYVLIVEAPSLTTRIGWYQEMFGLAQRKRPVFNSSCFEYECWRAYMCI